MGRLNHRDSRASSPTTWVKLEVEKFIKIYLMVPLPPPPRRCYGTSLVCALGGIDRRRRRNKHRTRLLLGDTYRTDQHYWMSDGALQSYGYYFLKTNKSAHDEQWMCSSSSDDEWNGLLRSRTFLTATAAKEGTNWVGKWEEHWRVAK